MISRLQIKIIFPVNYKLTPSCEWNTVNLYRLIFLLIFFFSSTCYNRNVIESYMLESIFRNTKTLNT